MELFHRTIVSNISTKDTQNEPNYSPTTPEQQDILRAIDRWARYFTLTYDTSSTKYSTNTTKTQPNEPKTHDISTIIHKMGGNMNVFSMHCTGKRVKIIREIHKNHPKLPR